MILYIFILFLFISNVYAHSRLFLPNPVTNELCMPIYSNSQCCRNGQYDIKNIQNIWKRGDVINVEYPRNNHIGGFIRWSIVEHGNDILLDKSENVFQYNCAMTTCNGFNDNSFASDPNWEIDNGNMCKSIIKIPEYLNDGYYTIQFRIHSHGDSYNIRNLGLMDFVSCIDLEIRGGQLKQKSQCPLFIYGDVVNTNKISCEFFKDVKINTCINYRTCYGWFARAPPKDIIECSSNIIDGGLLNALQRKFTNNVTKELNFEETSHPLKNPNPVLSVDLEKIKSYSLKISTTTIPVSTTTIPVSTPIKKNTKKIHKIITLEINSNKFKCVEIKMKKKIIIKILKNYNK